MFVGTCVGLNGLFAPEMKVIANQAGMKNEHGRGEYWGGTSRLSIRRQLIVTAQGASMLLRLLDSSMPRM